jgi:ribosomal protein S6--L-glutamate ligase
MATVRTVLVVSGESYWPSYFAGVGDVEVVQRRLQDVAWILRDGAVRVFDREGSVRPDGILWRLGAIRLRPQHRAVIDMLRLAGTACVNRPEVLARCFDRLASAAEMRAAGLPIVESHVAIGDGVARAIARPSPFVIKVGNHHGGLAKARVDRDEDWPELADLLFAADDYVTSEPYFDYKRDVRCLAVGDQMWSMSREGRSWRANVDTLAHALIDTPPELAAWSRIAMAHLGADILGLDFLETADGWVLLECNDTPGLSGFPEQARAAVAGLLLRRMDGR